MIDRPGTLRFAEIIDLPAMLLRRPLRRLFEITFVGLVVAGAPSMVIAVMVGARGIASPEVVSLAVPLAAVWAFFAGIATQLAAFAAVRAVLDGRKPGFLEAWKEALLPRRILTTTAAGVVTLLGVCLCVIPGLWFSVMLSLVAPILIDEPERGMDAMARSWSLISFRPHGERGVWVEVVGVLLVGLLISGSLHSIAQVPSAVYQALRNMERAAGGTLLTGMPISMVLFQAVTGVLGWIFDSLSAIYQAGMMLLMFRKAREVREAPLLERAFVSLAGTTPTSADR